MTFINKAFLASKPHIKNLRASTVDEAGIMLYIQCPFCSSLSVLAMHVQMFADWTNGKYVHELGLTPDEAELLISGTCTSCWTLLMDEDDDE